MPDQIFPEPTVGVFIFNQAGELLLLKSHKWFDKYVVPGGHVELGERLEEAAIREAKEETGLDVHGLEFICHQEFIHDPAFWKRRHFIFFDYIAQTDSLEVSLNDEAEEHVWVRPEAALNLTLDAYTRRTVEKILERRMS
jgi:nucleoside triphosphatase